MATWVKDVNGTSHNLDQMTQVDAVYNSPLSVWSISYYAGYTQLGIAGNYATEAECRARIAQLLNAVPIADIT